MKLQNLHIDESLQTLERLEASLEGKTLIVTSLKATDPDPKPRHSQITHITAVAVSVNTGEELGPPFNEEAELEIATMNRLKYEDNLKARDEWPLDQMAVRDWLNASGYNLAAAEAGRRKPSDLEVAMAFQDFYEEYDNTQVLIAHNIPFVMNHLNHILPYPMKVSQDIDTLGFARKFFMPLLRLKMTSGHDTSNKIGEKMLDTRGNLDPSTHNLGRAFNVSKSRHRSSAVEDVRQLAKVFYKMVGFVRLHRDMLDHPHFKQYAALQSQSQTEFEDEPPVELEPEDSGFEEPAHIDEPVQ